MPAWLAIALFALGLYAISLIAKIRRRASMKKRVVHRAKLDDVPPVPRSFRRMSEAELNDKLASIELRRRQYYAELPEEQKDILRQAEERNRDPRRSRPMNGDAEK